MAATTTGGLSEIRTSYNQISEEKKDSFFGSNFNSKDNESTVEIFNDKELIGLFFSGDWCPPCRAFLPHLIDFYKEINSESKGPKFEIIFASADKNEDDYHTYYGKMPWKAFNFQDERFNKFKNLYGVTGIPKLIILTVDGLLITKDGRNDIIEKGEDAWIGWITKRDEEIEKNKTTQAAGLTNSQIQPQVSHNPSLISVESPSKKARAVPN